MLRRTNKLQALNEASPLAYRHLLTTVPFRATTLRTTAWTSRTLTPLSATSIVQRAYASSSGSSRREVDRWSSSSRSNSRDSGSSRYASRGEKDRFASDYTAQDQFTKVEPVKVVISTDTPLRIHKDNSWMWKTLVGTVIVGGIVYYVLQSFGKLKLGPETSPKLAEKVDVKFDDVLGCDESKEQLKDIVAYLKNPAHYGRLGARIPCGVLLTGPPGTGKTLLAKAVAGEAGVPFYYASGSDFDEIFVGVGPKRVRELFEAAAQNAPAIVFIDEIDSVGMSRQSDAFRPTRTINQLLATLDGFQDRKGVVVIAATNFPEVLDKALTRPGRFDKQVQVPMPDYRGRKALLERYLGKVKAAPDVNTESLAKTTIGFSGADIANLVNLATAKATNRNLDFVTTATFEDAMEDIRVGVHRKSHIAPEKELRHTAYHEAGHALVSIYMKESMPLHKVTILPRGHSLGVTWFQPIDEREDSSFAQLTAGLAISMGGRAAEHLIYGPDGVTTGAHSDFRNATETAHNMVTKFGMSDKLGFTVYHKKVSNATLHLVEQEVKATLDRAYDTATNILKDHRVELERLADALLEHETLTREEVLMVIKGQPLTKTFMEEYTNKKKKTVPITDGNKGVKETPVLSPAPTLPVPEK